MDLHCYICGDEGEIQEAKGGWLVACGFCGGMTSTHPTQYGAACVWIEFMKAVNEAMLEHAKVLAHLPDAEIEVFFQSNNMLRFAKYISKCGTDFNTAVRYMSREVKIIRLNEKIVREKIKEIKGGKR